LETGLEDLSLHILDIAENALKAEATRIEIRVDEDIGRDLLRLQIIDNGRGMDEEMVKSVTDPFVTSRTERRIGLGLPLLAEAANMSGGNIKINSLPGTKTTIEVTFVHSNIDRKPLGDIGKTFIMLISGNPEVDFKYYHQINGNEYCLDTVALKEHLQEVPMNHPEVIKLIREDINQGLKELGVVFY